MTLPETARRRWEHLGQAPGTSLTGTGFVTTDETHSPCRARRFRFSTKRSPLASGLDSLHALFPALSAKMEGKGARVSRKELLKQLEMQTSAQEITHAPMRNAPWPSTPMRATEPQRQRAKTVCETCREVASLQRHWVTFGCVLLSTEARITNLGTNKISQMPHIKLSDPLHQTTTASRRNRKRTL